MAAEPIKWISRFKAVDKDVFYAFIKTFPDLTQETTGAVDGFVTKFKNEHGDHIACIIEDFAGERYYVNQLFSYS